MMYPLTDEPRGVDALEAGIDWDYARDEWRDGWEMDDEEQAA